MAKLQPENQIKGKARTLAERNNEKALIIFFLLRKVDVSDIANGRKLSKSCHRFLLNLRA